jgi:hypothetical protein
MDICIAIALSSVLLRLPSPVTLAWQHSVEHFELEEDWAATPQGLRLVEVRTEGMGAGIDLPADARRVGHQWRFTPALPPQQQVLFANSHHVPGYRVCSGGVCRRMDNQDRTLTMSRCDPRLP